MNIYLTIVQEFVLDNNGIPTAIAIEHDNITVATNENDAIENHIEAVKYYADDETFYVTNIEHSVMDGFPISSIIECKVPDGDNTIIIIETIKKETK